MPKYDRQLEQSTDLAEVRVITYFPSTLVEIYEVLNKEFRVFERSNKGADLIRQLESAATLRSRLDAAL